MAGLNQVILHCKWGEHGPLPCRRHAAEADAAARAAGDSYRQSREHLPARDVAPAVLRSGLAGRDLESVTLGGGQNGRARPIYGRRRPFIGRHRPFLVARERFPVVHDHFLLAADHFSVNADHFLVVHARFMVDGDHFPVARERFSFGIDRFLFDCSENVANHRGRSRRGGA